MKDNLNRRYIYRLDPALGQKNTGMVGWQVRLNGRVDKVSKLFSDNKYGGNNGALIAAIEFRDQILKEKNETIETIYNDRNYKVLRSSIQSNNTSGIPGVSRTISTERNGAKSPTWQTSFRSIDGKVKNRRFSIKKHGEVKALRLAVNARKDAVYELFVSSDDQNINEVYINSIKEYEEIDSYLSSLDSNESESLIEYLSEKEVAPTSKQTMLERRVSQHIFRRKIMNMWGNKCAVSGAKVFLIASHIKPWAIATDSERLDKYNGIALSPNYDKAFDLGYISFTSKGKLISASEFYEQAKILGINIGFELEGYTLFHDKYMTFHRNKIYRESP